MVSIVSNDQIVIKDSSTVMRGVKEIPFIIGLADLPQEQKDTIRKEVARERAKVDSYNPTMVQSGVGTLGGYGWFEIRNAPIWDYLTPYEKKQLKDAERLIRKGRLAEAHARFGGINMQQIFSKMLRHAKDNPREFRKFRRGVKMGTENEFAELASRFAGIENTQR